MNKNLQKAASVIKRGGIVIFPTDTAFGIGCRIDNELAINRLFEIRNRPKNKPVLILCSSQKMTKKYAQFTHKSLMLGSKFWPGGLTIVMLARKDNVPSIVRAGKATIGVRIPAHSTILQAIRKVGVPILAPSANFSGDKTPYKLSEVNKDLIKLVDFVMPGKCTIKEQSTIVDMTGKNPKIIRQGAVKI